MLLDHISDLSSLDSCNDKALGYLRFYDFPITDISEVASMSLLEDFTYMKDPEGPMEGPSIKDLSPLASCPSL